jgi:UDP-N-acetylglucosamine acyltransferase
MAKIHPTAVVCDGAILDDSVEVGPLCFVGPNVKIGAGTKLIAQCNIDGYTTLGKNNLLHPFASLGGPAQDHSVVPGEPTYLNIGDDNTFYQSCTIHTGAQPGTATTIGNHCMFMNSSHVAHNCTVGNTVIYVTCSMTAGHCIVMDNAILSGCVAVHQFCRIGRFTMLSGGSVYSKDIPPFMICAGRNTAPRTFNRVGLSRNGFSTETQTVIKHLFRIFYRSGLSIRNALDKIKAELPMIPEVVEFIEFCESSKRGVIGADDNE